PVVTTLNAKGVLDEHHPLSLGANLRLAAARSRAAEADVLLVVGSKLGEAELWVGNIDAQGTVVRVDLVETQLNKNQHADVGLLGDAQETLAALVAELSEHPEATPERTAEVEAEAKRVREAVLAESRELDPVNADLAHDIAGA